MKTVVNATRFPHHHSASASQGAGISMIPLFLATQPNTHFSPGAVIFSSAIIVAGCIADVILLVLFVARIRKRQPVFPTRVGTVSWSVADALITFLTIFLVAEAGGYVLLEVALFVTKTSEPSKQLLAVIGGLSRPLITVLFLIGILKVRRAAASMLFGKISSDWLAIKGGFLAFLAALPPVLLISALYRMLGLPEKTQDLVILLKTETGIPMIVFLLVLGVVIAPLVEEMFFRGFLYPAMKQTLGMPLALVLVALIFGALHFNAAAFVPLFVLGLALTLVYEITGSLWASIVTHAVFNAFFMSIALRSPITTGTP